VLLGFRMERLDYSGTPSQLGYLRTGSVLGVSMGTCVGVAGLSLVSMEGDRKFIRDVMI
jgi:hypothetical protein